MAISGVLDQLRRRPGAAAAGAGVATPGPVTNDLPDGWMRHTAPAPQGPGPTSLGPSPVPRDPGGIVGPGPAGGPLAPSPSPSPAPAPSPAPGSVANALMAKRAAYNPNVQTHRVSGVATPASAPAPAAPAAPAPSGNPQQAASAAFEQGKAQGLSIPEILKQMAAAAGGEAYGDDSIRFADGRIVDALINGSNEGGTATPWWHETHGVGGAAIPGSFAGAPPVPGAAPAAAPGAGGGFNNDVRDLLMQQIGRVSQPVGADDPLIQGEMNAQSRLLDRIRQQRRGSDAERMAFQGLNSGGHGSGAFDTAIASGYEDMGQELTGIQSQLFNRERTSRTQNLTQLLNLALASGQHELVLQLQRMIHDDNYGLNRAGLELQGNQNATNAVLGY